MADLIVREDLVSLSTDLDKLIGEFEGALDFQNDDKGLWGQKNANSSMGDFAANWRIHRDGMVKDMKTLRDSVDKINEAWKQGDQQLADSLDQKS
jgi:hypothetical protein